jgi:Fe-S cluster assembly protein SufD
LADLASLELPTFKGRPGWEFTDLSGFDPDEFVTGEPVEVAPLFEAATELVHGAEDGVAVEDGPVILPLNVARIRHPELVEPHLGTVLRDPDPFVDWAGDADGAFVWVPRNLRLDEPVLLTVNTSATVHRRVLVVLEEGAEAEVWEQFLGDGLLNVSTELVVGQNAKLRYICGQDLSDRSWIFGTQRARVERDGSLDWVALGFGGRSGRVRMETLLAGEGAHGKVTGAYAPTGRQHVDFDTTQEHGARNTVSDLAFRGILGQRSSAVWRGVIKVDPGAQQTDAFQECRNLLLSKRAHADAIPGLEILANDVRCTHAAAVAQIDRDQLFYLRARGLEEGPATRLVIEGFMAELVERFEEGPARDALAHAIEARLAGLLGVDPDLVSATP